MNDLSAPDQHGSAQPSGAHLPPAPARQIVPVPPDPELAPPPAPVVYRCGSLLVIEDGAELPQELCVRCGHAALKSWTLHPRNPRNPRTWFGRRESVLAGLCRKHREDHTVAIAATWSMLVLGVLLLVVGTVTLSVATIIVGVFAAALAGIFRAGSMLTLVKGDEKKVVLAGSKPAFLKQFSEAPEQDVESSHASHLSLF